jgi:hypothetical protein
MSPLYIILVCSHQGPQQETKYSSHPWIHACSVHPIQERQEKVHAEFVLDCDLPDLTLHGRLKAVARVLIVYAIRTCEDT